MKTNRLFLGLALSARAELLSVDLAVEGMDCVSCISGLETKLKRMRGVESVRVDASNNLVALKLGPGNTVRLDRIRDDIKGVGFTPKQARILAVGKISNESGALRFTMDGAGQQHFRLIQPVRRPALPLEQGKLVQLEAWQSPPVPQEESTLELIQIVHQ